jgi:hypothetical protein
MCVGSQLLFIWRFLNFDGGFEGVLNSPFLTFGLGARPITPSLAVFASEAPESTAFAFAAFFF